MSDPRQTLTLAEVADILGLGRTTVYRAVREGTFPVPVISVGARKVVARRLLERYLAGEWTPEQESA